MVWENVLNFAWGNVKNIHNLPPWTPINISF